METMTVNNQQNVVTKKSVLGFFAVLFSGIMEENVSPRQARAILNAIIAFFVLILTAAAPFWTSCLALGWFAMALRSCRRCLS
ncbi:MAG: hypothetical protein IJ607_01795 [Bacteroidaceae bacterium]|nr:hypothetical protein [Bacteroidaceae bacterium]